AGGTLNHKGDVVNHRKVTKAVHPKLAAYFAERAKGGVGMMITGGISPNHEGWLVPAGGTLNHKGDVVNHRKVTKAVHPKLAAYFAERA
ncbi:oxidoreductase, partial [Klebsiella pneumoniae]|uniref:oxidoreductase n=1 Tax=Klebsiella pneumoniae TaxID=573 RepID=UPI001C547044